MIAYNHEDLRHADVQEAAHAAMKKGCITPGEYQQIKAACPSRLYTPNLFIRIGLFVATALVVAFSCGLLTFLLEIGGGDDAVGATLFFYAAACYVALELFAGAKYHFHSGVDDALAWFAAGLALTGLMITGDIDNGSVAFYGAVTLLGAWFAVRFLNMLMALAAFAGLLGMAFHGFAYTQPGLLPFVCMGLSAAVYFGARRLAGVPYFTNTLQLLETAALIVFYLAGNYYVVRETQASLYGTNAVATGIPAGWLFWVLTVLVPAVYMYAGLRKKDRILLRAGLVLLAMIVFTIRYYHSVMPLEVAMVLGGGALILTAWALTRYLRTPKRGFTNEAPDDAETLKGMEVMESLVIAQTFKEVPAAGEEFRFGGGTSAGGGAGSEY